MFWGLTLEPGKKYSQTVEQSFHISMAAIEPSAGLKDDIMSVIVNFDDEEHILCSLTKNILQQALDLNFMENSQVSFHTVGGKAKIHLTGYVLPEENEDEFGDFEEGEEEMGDESGEEHDFEDDDEEVEEEEKEVPAKPVKRKAEEGKKKAQPELKQEPEAQSPAKKSKKEKKKQKAEAAAEGQKQQAEAKPKVENGEVTSPKAAQTPKKRKLAGGLTVEDLKEGNGQEAKKGKHVSVYYKGCLQSNNKEFDKTVKGPGFKFRLGAGEVIKGWDLGVEGMKVGGKRKLIIPAHLAYGPKGSPPAIPPNSTLVFDVELKAVH